MAVTDVGVCVGIKTSQGSIKQNILCYSYTVDFKEKNSGVKM